MTLQPFLWTTGLLAMITANALGQPGSIALNGVGDGGPALAAQLQDPSSIAVDKSGNIYFYERVGAGIRKVDSVTGIITTLTVGCERTTQTPPTGCFGEISHLEIDPAGNLIFSDFVFNRLTRLNLHTLELSIIAGNGSLRSDGDGGPATEAGIRGPYCFTVDHEGNIFVCDSGGYIRRIDAKTGFISTAVALPSDLRLPYSLAVDDLGNLFIADLIAYRIRRVEATTGSISPMIGPFSQEFMGEGSPSVQARMTMPRSLAFDLKRNLLFVVTGRVCGIDRNTGILTTIAGTGQPGFTADGRSVVESPITPDNIAVDSQGNLLVSDSNRIRRVDAKTGIITTLAGNGLPPRAPPAVH